MICILGRASRSYCIGLQNADMEMMLATSYCNYAVDRVKANVNRILRLDTNDATYRNVTKKMFKFKDYYLKHPLTRNF